tara:strand:- start:52630 stop:52818 length:189 start_codon:yes stop_codon:yes gene_type:complete
MASRSAGESVVDRRYRQPVPRLRLKKTKALLPIAFFWYLLSNFLIKQGYLTSPDASLDLHNT